MLVVFTLSSRVDAVRLRCVVVHHRIRGDVERLKKIRHPVHHRMPAGQVIHVLAQQQRVMRLVQRLVIRPHALLKTFEVRPAFAVVRVRARQHVRPRRTTDGVRAVSVFKNRSTLSKLVDVWRRVGHRWVKGHTTQHAPVPTLGVEVNDVGD